MPVQLHEVGEASRIAAAFQPKFLRVPLAGIDRVIRDQGIRLIALTVPTYWPSAAPLVSDERKRSTAKQIGMAEF
jgi:hypothetical protein